MLKQKLIILVLICSSLMLSELSRANVDSSCQRWFLNLNISPKDPNCEMKCLTAKKDFSSFTCGESCEELCQPIQCENPPPNQCLFYSQCIEDKKSCGSDGYAKNYGERYCLKFLSESNLSEFGQKWRDSTLVCLQKQLIPIFKAPEKFTCEQIKDSGFSSHVGCYTQSGSSFCELPKEDFREILFNTLELKDITSLDGMKQSFRVIAFECREIFIRRLLDYSSGKTELNNFSLSQKEDHSMEIIELKEKIEIVDEIERASK